jgi:hypothetical protein
MRTLTFALWVFVMVMITFLANTAFACGKDSSKDENAPRARCAPAPIIVTPAPPPKKAEEKK